MKNSITQILAAAMCLLLSPLASADIDTQQLINGYGSATQNYLTTPPYDTANLTAGGQAIDELLQAPFARAKDPVQQGIINLLTMNVTNQQQNPSTILQNYPAPLIFPSNNAPALNLFAPTQANSGDPQQIAKSETLNLDLNNLLGPLTYKDQQTQQTNVPSWLSNLLPKTQTGVDKQKAAQGFILYATGLSNPLPVVDFTVLKNSDGSYDQSTLQGLASRADVVGYLGQLRTYTAQIAASFGTLYHYYAERVPASDSTVKQLFEAAGVVPSSSTLASLQSPSALQVREYLATRRLKDPQWFAKMATASPIEIQRQTLFLEAEMRAEQFNMEMEQERTNALLAIMIAQNANVSKPMLAQTIQQIQGTAPFNKPQ